MPIQPSPCQSHRHRLALPSRKRLHPLNSVGDTVVLDDRFNHIDPTGDHVTAVAAPCSFTTDAVALKSCATRAASLTLRIVDVAGHIVPTLHHGTVDPGHHGLVRDARDAADRQVASGHCCTIADGAVRDTRKTVVLR